jgi:hypothetical protein
MNYAMLTMRRRALPPKPVPAIVVSQQPTSQTIDTTLGTAEFTVSAAANFDTQTTFQWQRSADSGATWNDVPGGTGSTLSLTGLTSANNGDQYRVVMSADGVDSVISNAVLLIFPVIQITGQPTQQTASGGAASFSVSASKNFGGTLQYQWEVSEDAGSSWAELAGQTASTLSLSGLGAAEDENLYRVVISATGATSVTSSSAKLLTLPAVFISVPVNTLLNGVGRPSDRLGSDQFNLASGAQLVMTVAVAGQFRFVRSGMTSTAGIEGGTLTITRSNQPGVNYGFGGLPGDTSADASINLIQAGEQLTLSHSGSGTWLIYDLEMWINPS